MTLARLSVIYETYSPTYDEPYHIASGMEWLDQSRYQYEKFHPPLARVFLAIGPYWSGARASMLRRSVDEGNQILLWKAGWLDTLTLARMGNLPFLALASVSVFLWGRRWFSTATGVWGVVMLLSLPPILGHGGLATLDLACAATLIGALYASMRWAEDQSWATALAMGFTTGVALLSKYSNTGFLAVCWLGGICFWLMKHRKARAIDWRQPVVAGLVAVLLIWAGFRFELENVRTVEMPLGGWINGILNVARLDRWGIDSYLLGEYRQDGWWYFFPVVLAVKTPIGLIGLIGIALIAIYRKNGEASWQQKLTGWFALAILLLCMSSSINLGVRHILAIYPILAVLAGYGVARAKSRPMKLAALALTGTVMVESWRAHPDYLAYFNPLAGERPEAVLVESDLDWGQDLKRLSARLKTLGIRKIGIGYFGTADLRRAELPEYELMDGHSKKSGYVAVSVRNLTLERVKNGAYEWLKDQEPIEKIGKTIWLYYVRD